MRESGITKWHGAQVFTLATDANIAAMKRAGYLVERDVKTHFTLQGTGAASRRTRAGKVHRASKPYQPPAVDTGVLRASIMSDVSIAGLNIIGRVGPDVEHIAAKAPVGTDVEYGLYLEVGTSKMKPRPFLRPALIRTRRKVNRIFKKANS